MHSFPCNSVFSYQPAHGSVHCGGGWPWLGEPRATVAACIMARARSFKPCYAPQNADVTKLTHQQPPPPAPRQHRASATPAPRYRRATGNSAPARAASRETRGESGKKKRNWRCNLISSGVSVLVKLTFSELQEFSHPIIILCCKNRIQNKKGKMTFYSSLSTVKT